MSSTSYPENAQDWRGRFIVNLAAGLGRSKGIQMGLWAPPGDMPQGVTSTTTKKDQVWLRSLTLRGGIAQLLRSNKLLAVGVTLGLLIRLYRAYRRTTPDLVHINWLQNALPLWGTKTPAVVSVLGTDFGLLRLPGMQSALRSVFRQRRTIIAPNAQWMAPELQRLFGDVARIQTVPFGIDAAWFALERRRAADGVHHWIVVTRITKDKIGDLFQWGEGQFGPHRVLHLFGPMQEALELPKWVQYHGATHPAELLTNWFPMVTGLITLSRHDEGRPQVMLEAMAAGLPIIASDLPAHSDFIAHLKTGWLTESQQDFANALSQLEKPALNTAIGQVARRWAADEIGTWDDCAARYCQLYASAMEPLN
nr:glycosyltransferase family 4 protein [uncultured Rhodoferax sp.]